MTDKELFERVLEAIDHLYRTGDTQVFDMCYAPELIPALKERLAQPEQEQEHIIDCPRCGHCCPQQQVQKRPQNCGTGYCSCVECLFEPEQPEQDQKPPVKTYCGGKPNYCMPEWVGLTEEEIKALPQWFPSHETAAVLPLIRAVEAKLREKNA